MNKNTFIFETLLLFVVINCINYIFFNNDPGYMDFAVHPYWLVVLLISSRYGLFPGVIAGIIACGNSFFFLFQEFPTKTVIEKMVEEQGLVVPLSFIVTGAVLGGIREKYISREKGMQVRLDAHEKEYKAKDDEIKALEKTKDLLEKRIVREMTTVKLLYDAARRIETMTSGNVYEICLDILGENFKIEKSSVYLMDEKYFILKATSGWEEGHVLEGKIKKEESIMSLVLQTNKYLNVKNILAVDVESRFIDQYGDVLAMFPLRDEKGDIIGIVNVEKIDFMLFNKPTLQLINLVTEWVSLAIYNRNLHISARDERIWDEETGAYTSAYFDKVISSEFERAREFDVPLIITFFKIEKYVFFDKGTCELLTKTAIGTIKRFYSETDLVFTYKYEGTFVVVSPMRSGEDVRSLNENIFKEFKVLAGKGIQDDRGKPVLTAGTAVFEKGMEKVEEIVSPAMKRAGIKPIRIL